MANLYFPPLCILQKYELLRVIRDEEAGHFNTPTF